MSRLSNLSAGCLFVLSVASLAFAASAPVAATVAPLEGRTLYLQAATVDTHLTDNLLASRPVVYSTASRHVVQLDGPITPHRRAALSAAGIKLQSYLPQNAYIADLSLARPEQVEQLGFVEWVGEYQQAWKIDPTIGKRLVPFHTSERIKIEQQGKVKLLVTLFEEHDLAQGMNDLAALGAEVLFGNLIDTQGVVDLIVPSGMVPLLSAQPFVQFIEESPEITLRNSTTRWIVQSNVSGQTPVHNQGITGVGQIVGIMDGKVNINHCSFLDSDPVGPLHRKVQAYNSSLGSDSHGTHVAGTSVGDNGVSNDTRGIAFGGRLVYNTIPLFNEAAIVARLDLHHSQGANIHTNSWGDDGTTAYNGLCRGIDVFSRNNEDDVVLFAVTNLSTLKNPENAKNCLAVGASRDTPQQHLHCSGGSGPTSDGRRKPEIYAPGCSTTSSLSGSSCSTTQMTGTSMASPAVAGVAMLVRQYYMDGFYPTGTLQPSDSFSPTGALTKATLLNTSVDMTGIAGFPSNQEGWGRVLADDALYFSGDTRRLIMLDDIRNASGLSTGGAMLYNVTVTGSTLPLKITLVFTDVAAASGAAQAAINDLDLEVTSPSSVLFLGNVFSGGSSTTGGVKDAKNNVEQVLLNAPQTGVWTVRVNGAAVNQSTQGFALVATGEVSLDPTCTDLVQNQGEDRIDCGGPCPPCECVDDSSCEDGAFCNGAETCDTFGMCTVGAFPCPDHETPFCNEDDDECRQCEVDGHCNDSQFCTGVETCDAGGACQPGVAPCTDPSFPFCIELTDSCDQCTNNGDCDDSDSCSIDACHPTTKLCEHVNLTIVYGDVDETLIVDLDDLLCLLNGFESLANCPEGDIDPCGGDGDIDVDDIISILLTFSGEAPCPDPCPAKP